jgi:hypothetical protein
MLPSSDSDKTPLTPHVHVFARYATARAFTEQNRMEDAVQVPPPNVRRCAASPQSLALLSFRSF